MLLLIDADIVLFRAGMAAEKNCWFLSVKGEPPEQFQYKKDANDRLDELLPGIYSRKEGEDYQLWSERIVEPVENALQNTRTMLRGIRDGMEVTDFDVRLFLSGGTNFRYAIAKTRPYKGNRDKAHRPTHEEAIRDFMIANYDTYVAVDEEADDMIGYEAMRLGDDACICTIDKDLNMIPGWHYNFVKQEKYYVNAEAAMTYFYTQLLTGDPTDNIEGIKGMGPKKAYDLLNGKSLEDQWLEVMTCYAAKGPEDWEDYLREQGQLLWIRRDPGEIWEPDFTDQALGTDQVTEASLW